ncbi:SIN component scaffold protein Sid4 [Schizosaccharomyces pombe]|uniref:Septation initiation protein sid4 n=1 Tax=Schizosaccharomyces pombe (strain 972 / ATCC 24843) TaxID=284812 RepID=SID4_SCHPO|nr:SIN component scaffold protein Sid4 [Schizosaccharomyces pombe]O60187.1 RecName: Full=Septation initiation protein sid4 [Schizosaccharomyces pombe 972h-]AAF69105.1 pioneer protein Sid4p [Schizosaccharomyces pombe]CAA19316.1 SIN component scaffold protein Sid4 [Schizosaccharomyces pombe]|eukprot:NP_596814.1 SIN component scaffold protein Sid4 [Schizosaccharomyces pombe]
MDEAFGDSLSTDYRWLGHSHFDSHPSAGDSIYFDSLDEDADPSRTARIDRIAELLDGLNDEQISELVNGVNSTTIKENTKKEISNPNDSTRLPLEQIPGSNNLFLDPRHQLGDNSQNAQRHHEPSFNSEKASYTSTPYKNVAPKVIDSPSARHMHSNSPSFPPSQSHTSSYDQSPKGQLRDNISVPNQQDGLDPEVFNQQSKETKKSLQVPPSRNVPPPVTRPNQYNPEPNFSLSSGYPQQHFSQPELQNRNVHLETVPESYPVPPSGYPLTSSTCVSSISQPIQSTDCQKAQENLSNNKQMSSNDQDIDPFKQAITDLPPSFVNIVLEMNATIQSLSNQCQQRDKQIENITKQLLMNQQDYCPTTMSTTVSTPLCPPKRFPKSTKDFKEQKPDTKQVRSATISNDFNLKGNGRYNEKSQIAVPSEIRVQLSTLDAILLQFEHLRKELTQARKEIQILRHTSQNGDQESNESSKNAITTKTTDKGNNKENTMLNDGSTAPAKNDIRNVINTNNLDAKLSDESELMIEKNKSYSTPASSTIPTFHTSQPLTSLNMPDSRFNLAKEKQLYYRLGLQHIDQQCSVETANMLKTVLVQLNIPFAIFPSTIGQVRRQLQQGRRLYQWARNIHYLIYEENMRDGLVSKQCLADMLKKIRELKKRSL